MSRRPTKYNSNYKRQQPKNRQRIQTDQEQSPIIYKKPMLPSIIKTERSKEYLSPLSTGVKKFQYQMHPSTKRQQNYSLDQTDAEKPTKHKLFVSNNKLFLEQEELKEADEPSVFMEKWKLSADEWNRFADRFPMSYNRIKLLGSLRGGFSLIWLGQSRISNKLMAIKQLPKTNKHETHFKEIIFCSYFFSKGGIIKPQYHQHDGSSCLCRMMDYELALKDIFIYYEVCGNSLGGQLYDFKTEVHKDKKYYRLVPQKMIKLFQQDITLLHNLIQSLAQTLDLLQQNNWVHSDIKSENILISYDNSNPSNKEKWMVKLIDYGSSFRFSEVFSSFSMATPEYMCPELLNFIVKENHMPHSPQLLAWLNDYNSPWVVDMWGLGCVILEIISGLPLWMSYETLVETKNGNTKLAAGLFAVKGRVFNKIIDKQFRVASNLDTIVKDYNYSGIEVDETLLQILKGTLAIDPKKRISPQQLLLLYQ